MGAVKAILSRKKLPERELHNSRLFVDLSENVHIHFRDLRLMFGVEEFDEFTRVIRESAVEVKRYLKRHRGYREQQVFDVLLVAGGPKRQTIPLQASPKPHESKYFPNRLQVELQEEEVIDAIHVHYRDYRLVMNLETFREFAEGIATAAETLWGVLAERPYIEGRHPFRKVVAREKWQQDRITVWDRIKDKMRRILGSVSG